MNNTWALVLAAGEGSRLRSLTTTANGIAVPKQFCSLRGGPSLLQETLHRAEAVASRQRICTIVAAQHRRWWEGPLWSLPMSNVIVQPENRGTANGILLPLLHIAERDPHAQVVLLPSDHYVRDEATLARSLRQAVARLEAHPREVLLLGIGPEDADPELGYIVPGRSSAPAVMQVAQFVEKPTMTLARQLLDRGALWNAFIMAGTVSAFLDLYRQRYPEILMEMQGVVQRDLRAPGDAIAAAELYERLPDLDFSRHVLEGAEKTLQVLAVPPCGWSDLGTPKRVALALEQRDRDDRAHASTLTATSYINLAAQHARLQMAG
jgi:mannose-1-phosphate guanylyltransferase